MKTGRKHLGLAIIVGLVIAFMALEFLYSLHLVYYPICDLLRGRIGFSEFTEELHDRYNGHLTLRRKFISLNGAFSATLDQSICNDVVRLKNGKLVELVDSFSDQTAYAGEVIEFSELLDSLDIPFLYVQLPLEVDLKGDSLPYNYVDSQNEMADQTLRLLSDADVSALDLRASLSATPDLVEKYFFRTDHHWNFTGAFSALQMIVQGMREALPGRELDVRWTDLEQWESHTLEKWFLGSRGKRVGPYFGGVDDFEYFTPLHSDMANISCAIPSEGIFHKGDFSDAIIFPDNFNPRDYFGSNPYALYLNDNYPLIQLRNPDAPNRMRVLFIRDSYALPVVSFASMLFQEIDVIDPRGYPDSIPRYVQLSHPDMVIDMIPGTLFHANTALKSANAGNPVISGRDVEVQAGSPASLPVALVRAGTYTFGFSDIEFTAGDSQAATVELYDVSAGVPVGSAIFDIAYNRNNGGFSSFLSVPEGTGGDFELRLYAGLPGEEPENGAIFRDFHLESVE